MEIHKSKEEYKLLLVEDEPLLLKNTEKLLKNIGYQVDCADCGEKALILLKKTAYDLVMTDLVMEKISGMDVLIDTKKKYPSTCVIMLTGYSDMKVAIDAIKNGADDFMLKPAESEEVYFRIRRCLENMELKKNIEQRSKELEQLNRQLKKDITERKRTERILKKTNKELSDSLTKLKFAQDKLIQAEKMASLGGLVSGVTHEINTPIGIGITASTFIMHQIKKLEARHDRGDMDETLLRKFFNRTYEGAAMINSNLSRACDLISHFKQVSVDQASEKPRRIIVNEYIEDVLSSLNMEFKRSPHEIILKCQPDLVFDSRPGALAQIITNFVMNAMTHAFQGMENGKIIIEITADTGNMYLTCRDNGVGIDKQTLKQIFDPFFTTRREQGGSGLGLYVVYNLVTQALNGTIECHSTPGKGTVFMVKIPLNGWE